MSLLSESRRRLLVRLRAGAVEIVGLALWFVVFTRLHAAAGKNVVSAAANAHSLQALERALHVDIERAANQWLTEHPILVQPAVYIYRSYYVVVLGVLVWAYLRHSEVYRRIRRTLVAMTASVLPVFWMLPMSPPRLALPGIVDIVFENDHLWGEATRDPNSGQNQVSAMPSLHVAWSLWCAYAIWSALRDSHPRLAPLAWTFPMLMITVVITTGNHYVLDVVGSIALMALSLVAARFYGRIVDRARAARA